MQVNITTKTLRLELGDTGVGIVIGIIIIIVTIKFWQRYEMKKGRDSIGRVNHTVVLVI